MTDNNKSYYVQLPDKQRGEIWDADKYSRNQQQLFNDHPDAIVLETSPFTSDAEPKEGEFYSVHLPGYNKAEMWDADKLARNKEKLLKDHPDVNISRGRTVDYWGDRLRETDSAIAPLEKRLGEIDEELSSPDIRVGGFRRADAVRLANEKNNIGKQLEGLYADRDNNYLYRKQREAQAKMFEDEDTKLSEMQKQLSDENPDAEKARRASLVGGGAGPHAASAQVFYRKDSDPEFNRDAESLALARIYIDEAKKTAFAPSKGDKSNGFANFFRGLQGAAPESISVVNLIKTGLDMHLVDAIKKIQETDGEDANIFDLVESPDKLTYLSSSEKELVKAFCIKSAVDAERAGDLSIGYQAGDSAMRSLGFMADFLMFGGEGSLANAAGKKATEGLLKATARASNRLALKGMARKAALAPAKFGIGTLEAAVKTAVMTPMMPSSWTNLTDNLLSVNDAGQVDLSGKAILNAMGDTFIENLSENAGEQVEAIIDAPFKLAGKAMSKVIPETKFTDWAKIFRNSGASRLMRDAAWHGYFGEIGEEWYGNALRVMTGVDKDALKNFATVDQQLITLISFAPMSVFGMGTSAGQYLSARKGMNKSAERLSALLSQNGYDEAQIRDILDVTKAENPTQLAAKLSPVITQLAEDNATEDSGAQIYRAVCDYAQAVARYRVFDGIHDADVSDQRNAMANELSDRAGLTSIAQTHDAGNGVTYETVRTLTDPDAGPAYVVGEQDGKLALVQADNGRKYFIPKEQIGENVIDSGEMPLNDFLDREIARKRSASEAERIETDRKQQAQEIFSALNMGDSINVGTEEDPAMGIVIAKQPDGRTVIQLPDGSVNEYTPSEIGNLIGKPISSKTDEQIETEAADAEQEVEDAVRWFRDARYSGDAQGLPFVMADGSTVVINDVRRGESTGSVTATITTSDGQETTTELPARSVNEAILGNSAVTDEAETKDDSTPRDFRGNPLPLKEDGNIDQTALWNNDPEAWAMWNDSVRNDGGENSLAYIETAAGKLKKDIKNIDKEYAKTTDFDKRDSLEGTRKNLQERLAALNAVRARYAERQNAEAAAKMQAGIERAKEARKAKADELAKYNTESLEGINKKWEDAPKDIGTDDVIVLPNGEEVGGNYVLTEAFAPTPSHDTEKGYAKTEGFPIDENGQTVNDRDYEHDKEAQRQVEQKAASYDQRALQTPVVVSSDGVVLSGNDRTMASQLAARQGTDTKYNEYLAKHPQKYGFTAEQVAKYSNPRVVFVPTESMPYTASTFAKFNAEEKKTQSKTESAVKAGKTITPETVATIAQIIDAHESIAETYADEKAVAAIIRALVDAGTVQENEISRLMDGNLLSGTGEDLVESVLLGAVMREDALRCAMGDKAIRRSIMSALTQLLKNNTYGEYSLSGEFSDAVVLLYQAKHSGLVKGGESIANFMNQPVLEGFGENPLAAATVQMIANTINGTKVNGLKNVLSLYNAKAEMAASGQADLFLGDVETKEQIIREILNEYGYDTETFAGEQQQSTAAAAEQPEQGSSEEQAPDAVSGDAGSGEVRENFSPSLLDVVKTLYTKGKDVASKLFSMKFFEVGNTPKFMQDLGLRGDKFTIKYGVIARHIGKDNSHTLTESDWEQLPNALQSPFAIAKLTDKKNAYRLYTTLQTQRGEFVVVGVDVKNAGKEIEVNSISTMFGRRNNANLPNNEEVIYESKEITPEQSSLLKRPNFAQYPTEQELSTDKGSQLSLNGNELREKITEEESKVNTNPSDAQKEAGNYRMGHVKIDGMDVTIENPKGSIRRGTDADGKKWESEMHYDYGYIRGTKAVDNDHIDIFLSDDPETGNVFVVDQVNPKTGEFDESKVMYGFASEQEAKEAYLSNYEEGWKGLGKITEVTKEEFKKWIDSSTRKTKPFSEYASVKATEVQKEKPVQGLEGYSRDEIKSIVTDYINDVMRNHDIDAEIIGIDIHGSRNRHDARRDSDLDVVVEYSGDIREDDMFNALNGEEDALSIEGIKVDINPIRKEETGNLQDYMKRSKEYDRNKAEEEPQPEAKNEGQFGLVSDERMAELKKRLLEKIKGQLNSGFDPELLSIGMEMAAGYIDRGIKTFVDFSKAMIADFGDLIRPYLKAFYNGARDMPGMQDLAKEMDGYDLVLSTDINTIGKEETKAEPKVEEAKAEKEEGAQTGKTTLGKVIADKDTRDNSDIWLVQPSERVSTSEFKSLKTKAKENNGYWSSFKKAFLFKNEQDANKFNNIDNGGKEESDEPGRNSGSVQINDERRANTAAAVLEAGSVASEAEAIAEDEGRAAVTSTRASAAVSKVDRALDKVNSELALLGYYVADEVQKDFNEMYGYTRNAEKKAVKDANRLAKKLSFDLGVEVKAAAKANIAPIGGDIIFRLQLTDGSDLYVNISVEPNSYGHFQEDGGADDLGVGSIMYRAETGNNFGTNIFLPPYISYKDMLADIRSNMSDRLPEQPTTEDILKNAEIISQNSKKAKKTSQKERDSQEKPAYLQDGNDLMGNLFGDLFDNEDVQGKATETEPQAEPTKVTSITPEENGLQGIYGVRPEGLRSDDSGHEGRLTEESGETGERTGQDSGRADGQGMGSGFGENRDSGSRLGHSVEDSTEQNSVETVSGSDDGSTAPASAGETPTPKAKKKNTRNNSVARGVEYAPKTPTERFKANIEAIKLMKELTTEERPATRGEMEVLRKYTGWGGLGTFFNNRYSKEYRELSSILTPEELQSAEYSINTAYFTPSGIIDTLWDIAKRLGFKGGNILEGSAGIGNMLASMPKSISENSDISAVELDTITGNMLKLLYPDADVQIKGFQDADIENNSVDLAITNVPFGTDISVYDAKEKDITRKFGNRIHDFCIAKNIRKLREGGIGIFITTNGTLDRSRALRNWVVNEGNADFIGAFRLNNQTFGGTPVTSDILIVRKRVNGNKSPNAIDVNETSRTRSVEIKGEQEWNQKAREWITPTREVPMEYNSYFVQHPEYMAGEMKFGQEAGDTFRPSSVGLYPDEKKPQDKLLAKWAKQLQNSAKEETASVEGKAESESESTVGVKEGQIVVNSKGEICLSRRGKAVPIETNNNKVKGHTKEQVVKDYDALKTAINNVLYYQTKHSDDDGLKPLLDELNRAYDDFTSKYGNLNKNTALSFLRNDVDFPSVAALEDYKEDVNPDGKKEIKVSKTDIFNKRVVGFNEEPHPANVKDGVIVSINREGKINIPYIAGETGLSEEQVRKEVIASGLGFVDPATGKIEVRYEYLSGNVREKLEYAKEHNNNGEYDENIKALEKVIPADIPAHLINFTLGSDWIDGKFYTDYAKERFGLNDNFTPSNIGGVWGVPQYLSLGQTNEQNRAAGVISEKTGIMVMGHELMLAAMNNTPVRFAKTKKHFDGTTETITDPEATNAAQAKIEEMRQDFCDWAKEKIMKDNELAQKTSETYNRLFNAIVPKEIGDEFLPERFPGSTTQRTLYPHQKKAVIRGTTEPVLLAHEVGTGKSYTLISTAMELRRLGLAKKPMIVVQNATVGQFVGDAKLLYPNSKILTVSDADRTAAGRAAFYAKIKYNDWDMIVVPQSVFEMIPDSEERQRAFIQEKIDEKMHVIELAKQSGMDSRSVSSMEKELKNLRAEYEEGEVSKGNKRDAKKEAKTKENAAARAKQQLDRKTDDVSNFDEMGIDALLIDEAHAYKHLGFSTQMQRGVKGVDPSYSKRSAGVYLKLQSIFSRVGRRNVVFATGTPISNTAAEIWTFMKYLLSPDVMKANHIYYFDDFVRNFGRIAQTTEFTTSGKYKETTRFSGYINLPELVRTWSSVADTVLSKDAKDAKGKDFKDKLPEIEGGKAEDIFLPQSPSLVGIMNFVKAKLDEFDKMSGKEKREHSSIPLVMYGIAQRAAIDPRLVDRDAADEPLSKTNKAVEEILKDLKQTESYKGTCAVFCDNYRRLDATDSKDKVEGFNLFKEMKRKLVENGVPEEQIVIMESGMSVNKKQQIFDKVIDGDVRVIMGTTQTLGTGVNIQTRLHAVIHMDAPNRPMDYTQRNGRILRQGNLHKEWGKTVRIIRFGVEDSLDVTAYQRLKTKSEFIDAIMNGKPLLTNAMEGRTIEEPDEGLFDNAVAQLSGSQYAIKVSAAEREIRKLNSQKLQYEQDQIYIERQLRTNEAKILRFSDYVKDHEKALSLLKDTFKGGKVSKVSVEGKAYSNEESLNEALKEKITKPVREYLEENRKNYLFKDGMLSFNLSFDGIDATVNVLIKKIEDYSAGKGFVTRMSTEMTYNCPVLKIEGRKVAGNAIKEMVSDFRTEVATGKYSQHGIEALQNSIERMEHDNSLMRERRGKPFKDEEKLKDAQSKLQEYQKLMKEEMDAKEAKYANVATAGVHSDELNGEVNALLDSDGNSEEAEFEIENDEDYISLESAPEKQLAFDTVSQMLSDAGIVVEQLSDDAMREMAAARDSGSTGRIELLKDGDVVYGAAVGGKIFLNADRLNPNTPIHEYTHLWDKACKARNPELWKRGVELMKQTSLWKEVENDPNYAGLDEDGIAGEVHARLSGEHGAETLERLSKEAIDENGNLAESAMKASVIGRLRKWLSEFWHWVKDTMTPWSREEAERVSIEDFINMPLADLAKGTKLNDNQYNSEERNIIDNAKKDGTFMKAPNGNPTNLDERQWVQVRTEAFKEWFGDWENDPENASKAVDENGEPKVLYHGGPYRFFRFDPARLGQSTDANSAREGFFFTDSQDLADVFAENSLKTLPEDDLDSLVEARINEMTGDELEDAYIAYRNEDDSYQDYIDETESPSDEDFLKGYNYDYGEGYKDGMSLDDARRAFLWNAIATKLYGGYFSDIEDIAEELSTVGVNLGNTEAVFLNLRTPAVDEVERDYFHDGEDIAPMTPTLKEAKENGRDGAIFTGITENGQEGPAFQYVVFNPNQIKSAVENSGKFSADNDDIRFSIVTDKDEIDRLNSKPTIKVYRAMQLVNGKLYPPMSGRVNGKWRDGIAVEDLGKVWEKADENPELADDKGRFTLNKGNGATLKARYNPYIHTSTTPLNDQFSSAQSRPELVTVEVEIPKSELTSGYKADKAKDSVGKVEWKAGVVQGKLSGTRTVILSRWDKPVRIVPESEVADKIVEMFDGKDITMPSNVVTPALRAELERRGVPFVETNNQGKQIRFRNGEASFTPEQIARMETPILESKGTFKNLNEAEKWAKENLQGESRTNIFTGEEISVGRNSISKMLSEKAHKKSSSISAHLAALQSVLDFIETGIPAETHKDTRGRNFDVIRLYNAIDIDGELFRVKSTARKVRNGERYYTYEIQEMELMEERRANRKSEEQSSVATNSPINSIHIKNTDGTQSPAVGLDSNSRPQIRAISGEELLRGVKKTNSDEEILSSRAKVGNESEKTNESSENQQDIELDREGERSYDSVPTSLNHSESGKRYAAEETASAIGVKVEYISRDEMPKGHENAKGMWKDGKIYIALENHPDANDVRRTVLHEAVGHKGLRRLVGERNMNGFCMDVYKALPASERRKIADAALQRYGGDIYEATEEYLAELAEDMDTNKSYDTIWDEIRVKTRNLLSKIGINIPLSRRDIRWILWQSYNANRQGDLINEAQRQVLADRLGFSLRADSLRAKAQEEIRLRSANGTISAANIYNNAVARASKRLHESWVEMTNSVNTLVEAIEKQTGKAAKSFEDIRLALNQQSSKELAAIKAWERDFYNPMMSAIKEMMDAHRLKREEIDRYAFLKHGLERNDVFAKRDAKAYYQSRFEKNVKKINGDKRLSELEKKLKIADAEQVRDSYFADIDAGTDKMYLKFREKDYGGLTALFSTFSPISPQGENETDEEYNARVLASRKPQFATLAETEDAARAEVDAFEKRVGKASITKLWDATNKATKSILKHQYESNMISWEQYTHVKDMFKYYVPMRGFADNTASDMYSYYASDKGSITPPLLRAKGRKTQAESPWGYIGAMASTAYAADFKNETKLALFYFISNRPDNDLVRISDVWYEKTSETDPDTGKPVFKQVYPEFKDGLNAAATRQEYDRWEADMEEKRKKGEAYKGTNGIDLQNSVIHIDEAQKNSHIIRFKVRGQEKMLLINGNPRAAQAINNELNIDAAQDGITKGAQKILRWMAGFNTSYNPEFWMSNAQRDLLFSIMATSIKESPEYTKQFIANLGRAVRVIGMIRKDKQGKLGSSYIEKMYKEFVDGGAVTGFTVIKDNEEWEQVGRQFTADRNKAGQAAMQALEAIQDFGEGIEQMTRFAAFLTARENGKSITEAVADAKELTVNFNRKGSGKGISWKESEKLKNRNGEKLNTAERVFYVGASMLSGYGRRFIMFFNASVQGLNTMYQLWTKDKRRTSAWMAGYFALGAINAMLHALLDDDDDYLDMPDYERRNNLLLGGKGNYFKWALPQESRVFYAMGDILVNDMILGRNPQKKTRGVGDILEAVGDIMPINPMNGLRGVVPQALVPSFENLQNEDYKGTKVYNEPRWLSEEEQKRTPKYTMAYSNTGRQFVLLSMGLNYISGGDSTDAGAIDIRPEKMEHLFEGLTGGLGTTLNRFWKSTGGLVIDSAIDANESGMNFGDAIRENASVRNTPFLNRLWVHNDDRYRNAHTSDVFNYYKAEAEHTQNLIRKAKKEGDADLLDRLYDDDKRMNILYIYRGYSGVMKVYDRMLKITDDKAERRQLMQEQDEYRKEMIQEIAEENK